MAATAFDTLQEAFAKALETQLATRGDIQRLEAKTTLIQWVLGIVIAAQVLPLLRSVGVL